MWFSLLKERNIGTRGDELAAATIGQDQLEQSRQSVEHLTDGQAQRETVLLDCSKNLQRRKENQAKLGSDLA
jgi:hypothetical protein